MPVTHQLILKMQFTFAMAPQTIAAMNRVIPCVLMRAGTSRGPFFLREWLPADDRERDEALIGKASLTSRPTCSRIPTKETSP